MSNIEKTEATVFKDYFGRPQCKISMLAGNIGDEFIKLYQSDHHEFSGNLNLCPFVGLAFFADFRSFNVWISSVDKSFPLYKGDNVRIKFVDETFLQINFPVGGVQVGREKRNISILNPREVLQLIEYPISEIELSNYKTGEKSIYKFSNQNNNQYYEENQGRTLLQIMVHRISALKGMINENSNIE